MHLCPICNRRTINVLDDDDDDETNVMMIIYVIRPIKRDVSNIQHYHEFC